MTQFNTAQGPRIDAWFCKRDTGMQVAFELRAGGLVTYLYMTTAEARHLAGLLLEKAEGYDNQPGGVACPEVAA